MLPSSLAADPDRLARFSHEARTTALLNHPNIVTVYDVGAYEGVPFVVSELLDGQTLRARWDQSGAHAATTLAGEPAALTLSDT